MGCCGFGFLEGAGEEGHLGVLLVCGASSCCVCGWFVSWSSSSMMRGGGLALELS